METWHNLSNLAVMFSGQLKQAIRIDWTIPATWVVGIFFFCAANLTGFIIQYYRLTDAIVETRVKEDATELRLTQHISEATRRANTRDSEIARQAEVDRSTNQRITLIEHRVDRMEDRRK